MKERKHLTCASFRPASRGFNPIKSKLIFTIVFILGAMNNIFHIKSESFDLQGNVGDSRCVASVRGHVQQLSFDHKPSNESETKRIIAAGGWVEFNRVNGNILTLLFIFARVCLGVYLQIYMCLCCMENHVVLSKESFFLNDETNPVSPIIMNCSILIMSGKFPC